MSVFELLRSRAHAHASKRSPDTLIQGMAYVIYECKLVVSQYKDLKEDTYPMNLWVYFKEGVNQYYVIMPNMYNNLSQEHVDELNSCIAKQQPPKIVFYGKDGKRNDVALLSNDEEIDTSKLQQYLKKAEADKRKQEQDDADDGDEPAAKKQKT